MRLTDCSNGLHAPGLKVAAGRGPAPGLVVSYLASAQDARSHESVTRKLLAQRLAALHGYEFAGDYDDSRDYGARVYFVPGETLALECAHALGIHSEKDLFGGVVPFPFVATKTITHPLAGAGATAPDGWSEGFADAVSGAVLPGYAAFSHDDARVAAQRLLERGPVRVKPSLALGGRGQVVVSNAQELRAALEQLDTDELTRCGVVVEQNLSHVTTYSVGQVRVADLVGTYVGTQKLVNDHRGTEVYGGSSLKVVRGDFDALLALDMDEAARTAIEQARTYDAAAHRCFPGFFASRRNYDIVRGADARGTVHTGVLEQSWRIGGASGAEVAALEAFRADAALRAVRAECTESYDEGELPPAGATLYYRGVDPKVGFITKYTTVVPHVDS